jgi:TolB-like protein/Flp pilus assembly protein TadD
MIRLPASIGSGESQAAPGSARSTEAALKNLQNLREIGSNEPLRVVGEFGVGPMRDVMATHQLGPFRLDGATDLLLRGSEPVALGQRAVALLRALVAQPGVPLSKDALIEAAWPGQTVEESNLAVQIAALRRVLGTVPGGERWIDTLPRRGYRYVGPTAAPGAERNVPELLAPAAGRSGADKPSIAVLPFANLGGDDADGYFCDGMVEEIITSLSRIRWLFVIGRNSTFVYKSRKAEIREIARELGVRYCLEGSVRKFDRRVRITGQLVDATSGGHLWAERYDGVLDDIFELQDRITANVAAAIEPRILAAEIERATRKSTTNVDAFDLSLRARPHALKRTRAGLDEATRLLRAALEIDPDYAQARAMLALCIANQYFFGHGEHEAAVVEAVPAAKRAVSSDRDDAEVLAIASYLLAWGGEHDEAADLVKRATELHPTSSLVCTYGGWSSIFDGRCEDGIALFQTALAVDPMSSHGATACVGISAGYYFRKRYEEAIAWGRRGVAKNPHLTSTHRYLAASLAQAGYAADARSAIDTLLTYQPDSSLTRSGKGNAFRNAWMLEHYLDGLRRAGLPE